ncbi:MAG: hypothetical protein EOR30_23700 [Mesorhizobium sp.]|uniref:hypothetical protein n=2 Tax=Mesorhizobium TaxID=68287 RepID=UPI000FCBB667|nr:MULTISPECIES: hypothetical protein [unclassified Mesorhizobium]RUV69533.1 hypothetical protein EOA78_23300 [Mesorhizobium sp. M5C.F.Cr.IN.023.01.1.1]RWF85685.1 MAG: hypothetical protein EOQ36_21290 [Mesorhizobium sp.]RWF95799.1 MAG: hypothetical protein EOQ45_06930 [Mesorhizobium sp.]RWI38160.1 MAG: hypothetical protein EOR14_23120 [Mesorhizobium sp.]RWI46102.1 MAG: hypothetical protein EOR15_18430 [Mesorhizobium sp.]
MYVERLKKDPREVMELFRDLLINVTDFFRDLDAAKYGALSRRRGRVLLKWSGEGDVFTLAWHEKDGPPVQKPEANGFGLSLLQGEIGYRLGGNVETTFNHDGLEVQLTFPLIRSEAP